MSDGELDPSAIQSILLARARELARPPEAKARGDTAELVVLALGAERYGVSSQHVQAIHALAGLTPVPGLPPFWAGLVNLRGRLYPVLNLRRYLGLPGEAPAGGKLVLAAAAGLSVALWVDEVPEVRQVPLADIGPHLSEALDSQAGAAGRHGLTPDLLAVLDLEALLADARLVVQADVN
jgi:purine-binding chemotaxis protein CheW